MFTTISMLAIVSALFIYLLILGVDLVITPANVAPGTSSTQISGTAGEAVTAGQVVYYDSSDGTWKLAMCDGTALQSGNGTTFGIALTGSATGQPIVVDTSDLNGIEIGATTAAGTIYCISATPGGICPEADLVATNYITIIGVGQTGDKIVFVTSGNTGIQHA